MAKIDQDALRKHFAEAILGLSSRPILIGPNWLRPDPTDGQSLLFVGVPKIAKALKLPAENVCQGLLNRLPLSAAGLTADVTDKMVIRIYPAEMT